MKKLKFGYIDPEDCIEQIEAIQNEENHQDLFDDEDNVIEIPLYDFEKTKEDNLATGTKYLLVPVRGDGFGGVENGQLLSEFSKIVLKQDDLFTCESEGHLIVVDYNSIFGLRLNRFINYNSDFFICDERVLFEFLLMKYEYFGFVPFFLSFPTIFREMGIKKDRAVTIIKKFKKLGFLESEIVSSLISGKQRQVTYYSLNTERIMELLPEIFLDEETVYDIKHDIEKYLKPGIKEKKKPDINRNTNQMQ